MVPDFTCHDLELVQHLQNLLASHPDLALFGLIDGTVENASLEQFFLLAPAAEYEPLFLTTEYAPCLPHSPYLINLTDADQSFLHEWGCWAEHRMLWWLSRYSLEQQAGHWRSLINVITPQEDNALFRFWDSRVLATYLPFCTDDERQQLLAPCHTLFIPQTHRQWMRWTAPLMKELPAAPQAPWWQVQPKHLQGFQASFEQILVDAIEDDLWRLEPERLQHIYSPALPQLIRQGMQQARELGLHSDTALSAFVRCQLRFGARYWTHPSLEDLWHHPSLQDQTFLEWSHQVLT